MGLRSFPKVLRRVAYSVEPFGFKCVQHRPLPLLFDGNRDRLGKQPGLFGQLDDGQANELQCVHKFYVLKPSTRRHITVLVLRV